MPGDRLQPRVCTASRKTSSHGQSPQDSHGKICSSQARVQELSTREHQERLLSVQVRLIQCSRRFILQLRVKSQPVNHCAMTLCYLCHSFSQTDEDRAMFSKMSLESDIDVEYHCPVTPCYYNLDSPRHFKSFKQLRSVSAFSECVYGGGVNPKVETIFERDFACQPPTDAPPLPQ